MLHPKLFGNRFENLSQILDTHIIRNRCQLWRKNSCARKSMQHEIMSSAIAKTFHLYRNRTMVSTKRNNYNKKRNNNSKDLQQLLSDKRRLWTNFCMNYSAVSRRSGESGDLCHALPTMLSCLMHWLMSMSWTYDIDSYKLLLFRHCAFCTKRTLEKFFLNSLSLALFPCLPVWRLIAQCFLLPMFLWEFPGQWPRAWNSWQLIDI